MKVQEVILKAMAGSLKWWEAAEIIGVCDRTMRRWRERYQECGYDGLYDRRKRRPSPKRIPLKTAEKVLQLYREKYFDFNVRHFHEKLSEEHGVQISYTWVKMALQGAGLVRSHGRRRSRYVSHIWSMRPPRFYRGPTCHRRAAAPCPRGSARNRPAVPRRWVRTCRRRGSRRP